MPSTYPPEKNREYMRDYMRRYRRTGAKQPTSWTEEKLTEPWEEFRARRQRERQEQRRDGLA